MNGEQVEHVEEFVYVQVYVDKECGGNGDIRS